LSHSFSVIPAKAGIYFFVLSAVATLTGCASASGWDNRVPPGVQIIRLRQSSYTNLKSGKVPHTVIHQLRYLATLGDIDAEYDLGVAYYINKKYPQAFKWDAAAAAAGHPIAQYNAGVMRYHGIGTARDYGKAFQWFRKSALRGDPQSQFMVASMYFDGKGTPSDPAAALHWYRQAAKDHSPRAAFDLGALYYNGNGVPLNHIRAYAWFWVAHQWGMKTWKAQTILSQTLSAAEFEKARALGRKLIRKPSDDIHPRPEAHIPQ
jgi:TPR repeat protein